MSGIDQEVLKLYCNWDAIIRYSCTLSVTEKRHYVSFYETAKIIHKEIFLNTRG
ncbi:hypothetical protein MTBBW1_220002 [Desulfamplus magnetovallimortis]|uniref:Uncharacterized protein n=1 Tax=Desulfamplus magnetovallimortis TaxID=1246637 RepID=A0A1W1HCW3_9BACT|nr:hypothetical protein MTBBW1_220002 [Desulfamplus magnetovallimortis]